MAEDSSLMNITFFRIHLETHQSFYFLIWRKSHYETIPTLPPRVCFSNEIFAPLSSIFVTWHKFHTAPVMKFEFHSLISFYIYSCFIVKPSKANLLLLFPPLTFAHNDQFILVIHGRFFFLLKCQNFLVSDVFGLFYPLLPSPSFLTPKGPICHCTTVPSNRNSGAPKRPQWNCIYKDVFAQILGHYAGLSRIHQDDRKRGKLLLPSELLRGSSSSFFLPASDVLAPKIIPPVTRSTRD